MKFKFDRDEMIKEISIAQEIISTKNALSILSNVLLIAENDSLTIKATDIKVNFQTRIPVETEENGMTTIFCDKFMGILSSLPPGDIEFIQEGISVTIKPIAKKVKFQLKSMASDKFPEFNSEEELLYFDVPADNFKDMITQTIFAVSDDETRHFMNGIFIEKKNDNMNMVATDGRRLSFISKPICQGIENFMPIIVPPKVLTIVLKRMPSEGFLSIAISNKNIYFKFGSYEFTSVLIEGQFPNYTRVIPEAQAYFFEIEKRDLIDALRRVGLLVEQKSRRIFFRLSSRELSINSAESDIGAADEEIPCMYDGEDITIVLNYTYVEEPMKAIKSDRIRFEFTEAMKAITIKPSPESDFFHIVMPMQA